MSEIRTFEGGLVASDAHFCIVVSRFNGFIVDQLVGGALDVLRRHGVDDDHVCMVRTPGAYELPVAVQRVARSGRFDAIIVLGAVIRGGTPHFEYVAGECVKGISQVALQQDIPVSFGVLTVDTIEQAIERAGTKAGNKGGEAALSALEMANLLQDLERL